MRTLTLTYPCRGVVAARPRSAGVAAHACREPVCVPVQPHACQAADADVMAVAAGLAVYAVLVLCIGVLA